MKRWKGLMMLRTALFGLVIATCSALSPNSLSSNVVTSTSSPTPTPTPTPTPIVLSYNVSDAKNNQTCILMTADISMTVNYIAQNGSSLSQFFQLSDEYGMMAKVDNSDSYCSKHDAHASMTIAWTTRGSVLQYLTFHFMRRRYNWRMSAVSVGINVTNADFNVSSVEEVFELSDNRSVFTNEYERSYKCKSLFLSLYDDANSTLITMATIELKTWQVQAFEFRNDGDTFGNARRCQSSKKDKLLPIAVGAILGLLLTAVVVVYILSRFRKRRLTHYESLK